MLYEGESRTAELWGLIVFELTGVRVCVRACVCVRVRACVCVCLNYPLYGI